MEQSNEPRSAQAQPATLSLCPLAAARVSPDATVRLLAFYSDFEERRSIAWALRDTDTTVRHAAFREAHRRFGGAL